MNKRKLQITSYLFPAITFILASLFFQPALAQGSTPPTDDEVNAIASKLYCPVCESTPLDVCPTDACKDWRELIRTMLSEGKTEAEILQHFEDQYGARVLAEPPKQGFYWLIYLLPPAIILAGAGLIRLGLDKHVTEWLTLDVMLPAPGQGALAIQCRADDQTTLSLFAKLEDDSTHKCVTAERAFLSGLGGGCAVPIAAHAVISEQSSVISLTGLVISEDGKKIVKVTGRGTKALELGNELAKQAIAQGADEILKLITDN